MAAQRTNLKTYDNIYKMLLINTIKFLQFNLAKFMNIFQKSYGKLWYC